MTNADILRLEAERDAARAGEARAVEALRKLHSAASYVAEECNEDDWTVDPQAMLDLHEALDAIDVEEPQPAPAQVSGRSNPDPDPDPASDPGL